MSTRPINERCISRVSAALCGVGDMVWRNPDQVAEIDQADLSLRVGLYCIEAAVEEVVWGVCVWPHDLQKMKEAPAKRPEWHFRGERSL